MIRLKRLKAIFTRKRVLYTQLTDHTRYQIVDGKIRAYGYYVYGCHPLDGGMDYYEVFKYFITKPHPLATDADQYDYVEYYPGDESFGVWAWCCNTEGHVKHVIEQKNLEGLTITEDN